MRNQDSHGTAPRAKLLSRRGVLIGGAIAGASGAVGLSLLNPKAVDASQKGMMAGTDMNADMKADMAVLNGALYYEHQAIWAYGFAAGKLSRTEVGKAVLALALRNQADHKAHRDTLAAAITSLGGMPVEAKASYDVSAYLNAGEGNLESDVNIAKLALALEVDAAIAYGSEVAKLKAPALIQAGASIGSTESAHASAIRATFKALGVDISIVPAAFISADTRNDWVLRV